MERSSPICEVAQHDSKIYGSAEYADAETTNAARSRFSKVCRRNNSRLTNPKAHDEPPSKNLAITSIRCDIDNNADDPDKAKLSSGPYAS